MWKLNQLKIKIIWRANNREYVNKYHREYQKKRCEVDPNFKKNDCIFVFSVGGGNKEKNVSANLVYALEYAKEIGAKVVGVVGRDGGYTAKVADACCIIPTVNNSTITPHTEGFQALVWHLLVSHPKLQKYDTKWESVQ